VGYYNFDIGYNNEIQRYITNNRTSTQDLFGNILSEIENDSQKKQVSAMFSGILKRLQ
jgi:hypothetical protein